MLQVLDKHATGGQNCYQEEIPSMFPWWPKKVHPKSEEAREAYLRRLREVLEDCTKPRCTGRSSQITPADTAPAVVGELHTGALSG